jgi:hypothetical protein
LIAHTARQKSQLKKSDVLKRHPDMQSESITREDTEDLQVFVYAITEYVYDLAERYEEFKERQERRAKARRNPPPSIWGDDD